MNNTVVCPDNSELDGFLNGSSSSTATAQLIAHLDACSECRRRLETAAAAEGEWQRLAHILCDSSLGLSVSDSVPDTEVSRQFNGSDEILGWLAPTDDPQMLGRLGPYEIVGLIGRGGMGIVLKGFDRPLNRFVAIKVLAPPLATSSSARQRFAREARAAAAVVHEHVIAIHSVAEFRGLPYLVMPYMSGPSLQRRIDRSGALQVVEILRIARQVALGLAAAHEQGLVHRDVKPANILLEADVERVTITDFGLARAIDDVSITQSGVIAGTPQYMSPEQSRGEPIDHRSDLFSLGCVIYAMCIGRPPFGGAQTLTVLRRICEETPRSIRELNPEIPEWLDKIVMRLLSKAPEQRFQSANEVAGMLDACLAYWQQPTLVPPPSIHGLQPERPARHIVKEWSILVASCILIGGGVFWLRGLGGVLPQATSIQTQQPVPESQPAARQLLFNAQPLSVPIVPEFVRSLSFSKDGRLLAAGYSYQPQIPSATGGTVVVYDVAARRAQSVFFEAQGVSSVALSAEGTLLAYGTFDRRLIVRSLPTGTEVFQYTLEQPGPAVTFSPDGGRLACATGSGEVLLWDTASWTRSSLQPTGEPVPWISVAFSGDGSLLAAGGGTFPPDQLAGQATVWDVATGQRVITVRKSAAIMDVTFDSAGKHLLTACLDTRATLWELSTGDAVQQYRDPEAGLNRARFVPESSKVATMGPSSGVKLWEVGAAEPEGRLRFEDSLLIAMAVSPDGKLIASGGRDRTVRLWEVATREPVAVLRPSSDDEAARSPVLSTACSPDGRHIALGREDGSIVLRKAADGEFIRALLGHEDQVTSLLFTPDGRTIISASYDNTVRLWNAETGELARTLTGHRNWVMSLAISPAGDMLASGSYDRSVQLWELPSGNPLVNWEAHGASVRALAFSNDGSKLLTGGSDHLARVWNVEDQKLLLTCDAHKRAIRSALFSADGATAVTASEDGRIVLWDAKTGFDRRAVAGHTGMVWCLAFAPDGKTLVSGGDDRLIRIWDLATLAQRQQLSGHADSITAVAFTPGQKQLVSTSLDRSMKIWTTQQP